MAGPRPALLAVDGGASKTDVVLVAADGTVLGRARGPASNHQMVGLTAMVDNLAATIAEAAAKGPVAPYGVYCLAGVDLPVDEERVGAAVRAAGWTARCDVRNDAFAVLRAGATGPYGVGLVCGTGLNCVGVGPGGRTVRFPSLGELSGDFTPGGAWLGVRGLGLALRAGDGRGEPTALSRLVPEHLGLDTPEAVLGAVYTGELPFGRLVELARVVLEAAEAGDGPAAAAVDLLVDEVVAMAAATLRHLGLAGGRTAAEGPQAPPHAAGATPPGAAVGGSGRGSGARPRGAGASGAPVEVVAGGGVFENARFAGLVLAGIRRASPGAVLRPLAGSPPVLGAALLGLDALGAGPTAEATLRAALA